MVTAGIAPRHAAVLAAGRGTRLGGLTADRPKPMVEVGGKPVLEHILAQLISVGIAELTFVVGYRGEMIRTYFGDGARWGVRITYVEQPEMNGTGAAIGLAERSVGAAPFVAAFGDILTATEHYRMIVADFASAPCTAVVGINPVADPYAGAAVYRDGNRVTRVVEKPARGTAASHWNLAGVSVYTAAIWPAIRALRPSARGEYEITDAIEALVASGQEVRACEFDGYWSDIGTPEALEEAERYVARQGASESPAESSSTTTSGQQRPSHGESGSPSADRPDSAC